MKKIIKNRLILQKFKRIHPMIESHQYTWGEIKAELKKANIELQDDDRIEVGFEEEEDYGDAHSDASYYFKVIRPQLETDEELADREEQYKRHKAAQKLVRKISYEQAQKTYENLKEEFEHEYQVGEKVYFYKESNKNNNVIYYEGIIDKIVNGNAMIQVTVPNSLYYVNISLDKLTLLK